MNPYFTAMRLARLILDLNAKNTDLMDHFQPNIRRPLLEAIRDHEDALARRQVEDAEAKTVQLCTQCSGSGVVSNGDFADEICLRCLGTGWEEL